MDKNSVMNAAFIGCGAIAQKKHLPLCAQDPRLRIRLLYDTARQTAEKCRETYGDADTETAEDITEIYERKDVDVVFVSTPNCFHAEQSIRALKSGKHVICEKPMALDSEGAREMLKAASDSGKLLHISYQNRFTNQALYTKRLAEEGFFGDIYYAKAYAVRRRAVPTWGVTTNRKYQGGGPLIDIGSHAIDLALWLADNFEPSYVSGMTYDKIAEKGSMANYWGPWDPNKMEVEDCALGFIVMKNGMTLTVDASYALNTVKEQEASVDLFGADAGAQLREEESVMLVHEMGGRMCITGNDLQKTKRSLTPEEEGISPSQREHRYYMNLLFDGKTEDPYAPQALVTAEIIEAIYRSAREKRPVYLERGK